MVETMGIYPKIDFTSLTLYVKSPAQDFNHAFSHEERLGITSVRDKA